MDKFVKDMSVKELKGLVRDSYLQIYRYECFGKNDLYAFEGSLRELEKRGYEIEYGTVKGRLSIRKVK